MLVVFLLGFGSGLPLMLVGQTLKAWMTDAGIKVGDIARLSWVGLAYTFKWAWAPLLDRYQLPFLGRRRGWLIVFQLALVGGLLLMASADPRTDKDLLILYAVIVAFTSASHDIVIDAYNVDTLGPDERAAGSAVYVMGYRVAMLVTGTLALVLADHIQWQAVYLAMACLMSVGVVGTLLGKEPAERTRPSSFLQAVYVPFAEFFGRLGLKSALLMLSFAAAYKFGEQFAQVLTITFYKRVIGFSNTEVGLASKTVGFIAWLIGGAIGGTLVAKFGVRKMIVAFGLLQASTHVAYLAIAVAGHNITVFAAAIFIENLSFAMATGAFVAALMSVCNPAVSATQFALLTSLTSVGERVFGFLAADVVHALGWKGFFVTTIFMSLPGVAIGYFATAHMPVPPREPGVLSVRPREVSDEKRTTSDLHHQNKD